MPIPLGYRGHQDWDKKLPFFLLAYRSAVHETTGYSPSQMLFCSAGHQMHPWRMRSMSRNSRRGWRKHIIWVGKESAWLPRR
ncbi:hypothetical protein TNCV_1537171 [Trichonephila clavipes]|nr:hypothetical protein TNCV_1537171 [Trichonephila clavipes]